MSDEKTDYSRMGMMRRRKEEVIKEISLEPFAEPLREDIMRLRDTIEQKANYKLPKTSLFLNSIGVFLLSIDSGVFHFDKAREGIEKYRSTHKTLNDDFVVAYLLLIIRIFTGVEKPTIDRKNTIKIDTDLIGRKSDVIAPPVELSPDPGEEYDSEDMMSDEEDPY